jgi:hypothetical protein
MSESERKPRASAVVVCFAVGQCVVGCHSGGGDAPPAAVPASSVSRAPSPPPQAPRLPPPWFGYFSGWSRIDDVRYLSEAILTVDGSIRLSLRGPYEFRQGGYWPSADLGSAQFLGTFVAEGDLASGSGLILGMPCEPSDGRPFCGWTAPAQIEVMRAATGEILAGEMLVSAPNGAQSWSLEMYWRDPLSDEPGTQAATKGTYAEQIAAFTAGSDVIATVDGAGQMFFQSPGSGCVGSGTFARHRDAELNVYDAALMLENCDAAHAHLNGIFEGLAARTSWHTGFYCQFYYDRCDGLVLLLSTLAGAQRPAAFAMWLNPSC